MPDKHVGVGKVGGTAYTSENVDRIPDPPSRLYRIETYVDQPDPSVRTVYYMPAGEIHDFFREYRLTDERVVDVRPIDREDAEAEIEEYRRRDDED
jgi:hypothetical protein